MISPKELAQPIKVERLECIPHSLTSRDYNLMINVLRNKLGFEGVILTRYLT